MTTWLDIDEDDAAEALRLRELRREYPQPETRTRMDPPPEVQPVEVGLLPHLKWLRAVWADPRLSGHRGHRAKLVAAGWFDEWERAEGANPSGTAEGKGYGYVAAKLHVSKDTVRRGTRDLVALGYISEGTSPLWRSGTRRTRYPTLPA